MTIPNITEVDGTLCPDFTILVPTCNEEKTISLFIDWCFIGIKNSGLHGEILIVDSSNDRTAEIASAKGARVLITPKRGLGHAYIDGIPHVRGEIVIMGDADCTYDFRDLKIFIDSIKSGSDFVMGSRWLGSIEEGAMPFLHRYIGTPLTTWILNFLYGSTFSDIHCGMRAITLKSLKEMEIKSRSWEYASEMVVKSVLMELKTGEVPIKFYKDREDRVSHHIRQGWTSPFRAAWINLKLMFTYRIDVFSILPGWIFTIFGFIGSLYLLTGTKQLFKMHLNLGALMFLCFTSLIGEALLLTGIMAKKIYENVFQKNKSFHYFSFVKKLFGLSLILSLVGIILIITFLVNYFVLSNVTGNINSFTLRIGLYGCFLLMAGCMATLYSLLFNLYDSNRI